MAGVTRYRNNAAELDVTVHVGELLQDAIAEQLCKPALHCCHWNVVAVGVHDAVTVTWDPIDGYLVDAASEQYGIVPLGGGGVGLCQSIETFTGAPGPAAFAVYNAYVAVPSVERVVVHVACVLVHPTHRNAVGPFAQFAFSVRLEPVAGEVVFAPTLHTGAPLGGVGTTSPPVGLQNATGVVGLPSPSGM